MKIFWGIYVKEFNVAEGSTVRNVLPLFVQWVNEARRFNPNSEYLFVEDVYDRYYAWTYKTDHILDWDDVIEGDISIYLNTCKIQFPQLSRWEEFKLTWLKPIQLRWGMKRS
jgi:hypothetical protein